jgi:hypothetical protein
VGAIIGPAWSWRWQAPELALVFGERALRTADQRGDQLAALWARTLVVSASCRLGQQLAVVDKAIEALRLSERLADDAAGAILRVELAGCARSAGVPLVGAGLLRPVLSSVDARPAVRAAALIQLAGCLAYSERHRELDGALAEADQLYADDRELDQDAGLGRRAVLRSFVAREHRRRGDLRSALHAAEEGADLLDGLSDPTADGGAAARISLQQVLGLLDLGWVDQAATVAAGALSGPVRAHSAAAVGWLALAVSTRVQLPAGLIGPAIALLQEITAMAERHHRDALHAEGLSALSEAHEQAGELAETLDYLRSAQVIRARRSRALRAARSALLGAFGEARNAEDLLRLLNPTLSTGRRRTVEREAPLFGQREATGQPEESGITLVLIDVAKNRSGLSAPRGPVTAGSLGVGAAGIGTWTAESLGAGSRAGDPIGESVLRKVVEHLRDLTPAEAALARVGGAELAVLLPGTSRSQVERWAEELRAAMANVDWGQVTPGLTVNVRTVVTEDQPDDAAAPQRRPGRAANPPASGIALDAQPTRSRRAGERTSPRLPIPPQPAEPERSSALVMDRPVPPARTPVETPEQSGGRRSRGNLPVEPSSSQPSSPEPVRTPLPQASLAGLLPEPQQDPAETARRRHAASQEPTQRWKPVWLPADEESSGRWLLEQPEAKPEPTPETVTQAEPRKRAADAPTGLDRFGLGSLIGTGRRRSEDAEPESTPDSGRRRAEETPSAEPGSRHSAPADPTRSVLGSLGISTGSGGRRRAPESTDPAQEPRRRADEDTNPPAATTPQPTDADSEPTGRRARRDYSQPLSGLIPTVEPSSGGRRRAEDTIPKIRLPQLPIPPQPSSQDPRLPVAGFPGAAFPGSGFAGFTPQTGPPPPIGDDELTPPSGFALPAAGQFPPPAQQPTSPSVSYPPAYQPYQQTAAQPNPYQQTPYPALYQPTPSQPSLAQPYFAQPNPGQSYPGQSYPGQSAPAQPVSSQPSSLAPSLPEPGPVQPPSSAMPPAGGRRRAEDAGSHRTASGYVDLGRISAEFRRGYSLGEEQAERAAETVSGPAEPAPVAPTPVEPAPAEPAPVGPALVEPIPVSVELAPAEHASVGAASVDMAPVEPASIEVPAAEPAVVRAAVAQPAEPAVAEPGAGGPSVAGFGVAEPSVAEPGVAGPAAGEPVSFEPVSVEPPSEEPASVEAALGAEGGSSSFSALSEFSAMLARFDDNPAPPAPEASTPEPAEPVEPEPLPEPELTPPSRAEQTPRPFSPETMFGGHRRAEQAPEPKPEPERVEPAPEPLRPSPPPTGIAAKLSGPQESESDVASIEGRSGRGRRRSPKLGDLLTEALRAYQDVRDSDDSSDALSSVGEPSELGATELSSWLGTGTEPVGSIEPPSWRPGSSTRSFGVSRHGGGDDSGDSRRQSGPDWNPPTG